MSPPPKISHAQFGRLWAAGETLQTIGDYFGVTKEAACHFRRRHGYPVRFLRKNAARANAKLVKPVAPARAPEPPAPPPLTYAWVNEQVAAGVPRARAMIEFHRQRRA